MQVTRGSRYRCHYTPLNRDGWPVPSDTGILPFVQLRAANAELATRAAHAITGCPIDNVERQDDELPDEARNALARAAGKQLDRRFTGEPVTGFGAFE